jgi:hypothetical protein
MLNDGTNRKGFHSFINSGKDPLPEKRNFRRWEMDVPRLFGKAIVMIIPTFVGTVFRKDIEELKAYLPRR